MCLPIVLLTCYIMQCACAPLIDAMSSWKQAKAKLKMDILSHQAVRLKLCPAERNTTVQLKFLFYCYQVLTGDELEQSFTSVNYIEMYWKDPNLAWNPEDYAGVNMSSLPYDEMWHPNVLVTNSANEELMLVRPMNDQLTVYSDGSVMLSTPAFLKTTCSLDLTRYPFDAQKCDIIFIPFFEDCEFEIVSAAIKPMPDPFHLRGEWEIQSRNISASYYGEGNLHLPLIKVSLRLSRSPLFYVVSVLAPMLLTSVMTSFVFCIPSGSGEKVSFLVTVFVSNAVFLNFIAGTMPRSMTVSNMPRLTMFLIGVMVESFFALLATLFVIRIYNIEQKEAKVASVHSFQNKDSTMVTTVDDCDPLDQNNKERTNQNAAFCKDHPSSDANSGKIRSFIRHVKRNSSKIMPSELNARDDVMRLSTYHRSLWHPRIVVTNAASSELIVVRPLNDQLQVEYTGSVFLTTPVFLKTTCPFDLTWYPFDTQECEIIFLPFLDDCDFKLTTERYIELQDPFQLKGEWDIVNQNISTSFYISSRFPTASVSLKINRSSLFYVITVIAPMVLTPLMTNLVFLIHPESGEKVSFLVSIFVSNAVFLNFISGTIPRSMTLSKIPRLTLFLIGVMIQSFLALLATIFVMEKYKREQGDIGIKSGLILQKTMSTGEESVYQQQNKDGEISHEPDNSSSSTNAGKLICPLIYKCGLHTVKQLITCQDGQKISQKGVCCMTARWWDTVFFILFNLISIPFYVLLTSIPSR
ncbi:hypothetical protein Btru_076178 [Bulinus truncatus]|nr:hypothetical protein Btru_076178 [Bulinus truncatus]